MQMPIPEIVLTLVVRQLVPSWSNNQPSPVCFRFRLISRDATHLANSRYGWFDIVSNDAEQRLKLKVNRSLM